MHFTFPFTVVQVLWTLTFAAQLVLLVVMLGRDRMARYPWFTASIALSALRLLVEILLTGRMSMLVLQTVFLSLATLSAIVGLMVVMEIARRAFDGAHRLVLINGAMAAVVVSCTLMAFFSPWPLRQELTWNSLLAVLRLLQLAAQKMDMLGDLLAVELGLLVVIFGRRFKAGWRSHTQAIALGLSIIGLAWLAVQAIWINIAKNAHPTTRVEYDRIVALGNHLVNTNKGVYVAVLIWWLVWLWFDEPGTPIVTGDEPPAKTADIAVE
jgi:hypothetical protein